MLFVAGQITVWILAVHIAIAIVINVIATDFDLAGPHPTAVRIIAIHPTVAIIVESIITVIFGGQFERRRVIAVTRVHIL